MSYQSKSNDSFNTRKRFYVFYKVIHGESSVDEEQFMKFDIDALEWEPLVKCYLTEYFHYDTIERLSTYRKCTLTIDQIYNK